MRRIIVAICLLAMAVAPSASAEPITVHSRGHTQLERKYLKLYWGVVRHHGRRAPGRNIITRGIRTRDGHVRLASRKEVATSIRTFRRWLAPPIGAVASTDQIPHGQAAAYTGGRWAIPSSIVMCESGGDYGAVNTSNPNRPAGAYQIITSTWLSAGGGRYAPTADRATPAQQDEIVGHIWNGGAGRGQWAC